MKDLISSRDIMYVLITVSVSFYFLVEMHICVEEAVKETIILQACRLK